jgi:hypothetical protein
MQKRFKIESICEALNVRRANHICRPALLPDVREQSFTLKSY